MSNDFCQLGKYHPPMSWWKASGEPESHATTSMLIDQIYAHIRFRASFYTWSFWLHFEVPPETSYFLFLDFCCVSNFSIFFSFFFLFNSLPLPWLLYAVINNFSPVTVSSNGLFCAIVLLFIMLLFVILSIAFCKWRMNKFLGFLMFGLYFVFLIVSVLLEDKVIQCPVSI